MHQLRGHGLSTSIWITAFTLLLAGIPHAYCVCIQGQPRLLLPGLLSTPSCCSTTPTAETPERPASAHRAEACCDCCQSAPEPEDIPPSRVCPARCHQTLAEPPTYTAPPSQEGADRPAQALLGLVEEPSPEASLAPSPALQDAPDPGPPVDLVTLYQHFTC